MARPALRLAITGGIGSGKSTVASIFAKLGATLVDADALSHELTATGGAAIAPLVAAFGASILRADGALDRNAMRAVAFADPLARRTLEQILHPLVTQLAMERGRGADLAGSRCTIYDIPLLTEASDWRQRVDQVLVVDCAGEIQMRRVMIRSQLSRTAVEAIMAAQATRERRLHCADIVIDNTNLSLESLDQAIQHLASRFGL